MNTTRTPHFLRSALGLLLLLGLLLADVSPAFAALRCYVDADAILGLNTGASWLDAYTDLQSALANTACTEIWVAAGTYKPTTGTDRAASFQLRNGIAIYGGFAGTETARTSRRPRANRTILSGEIGDPLTTADNSVHVVMATGTDSTAVLNGFTITAGNANIAPGQGGGMYNSNSTPALARLIFRANSAIDKGGAIYNDLASPRLTNVNFDRNSANRGGAIYNNNSNPTLTNVHFRLNATTDLGGSVYNYNSNPSLTKVTFTSNLAVSGGAIYNYNSNPTLTSVTFTGNSAAFGGGAMYNLGSSPVLKKVAFNGNTADTGGGAGMYNDLNSNPNLSGVTFTGNKTNDLGGGMYNSNSTPVLATVTFKGNTAVKSGGGMYNVSSSPSLTGITFSANSSAQGGGMWNDVASSPSLTKVTFSANKASESGGGMFNAGGSPTLARVVFAGNSADDTGGGMTNGSSGSPSLQNVTFRNNSATRGGGMWNGGADPTLLNVTFRLNSAVIDGGGIYNTFGNYDLTNATFSRNSAGGKGGALYNEAGTSSFTNVTFNRNSAALGGAINNLNSSPVITNSILYSDPGGEINVESGTPVVTYSIVQGGFAGLGNLDINPRLKAFGRYGGLTKTMPLGPGSPAIDAGENVACPPADQRGIARPQDGNLDTIAVCDMGATESRRGTLTFQSTAAEDGWILEREEFDETGIIKNSTATTFFLGDDRYDRQYRSILSFDTATLPDNAVVTSATLQILRARRVGTNPFKTHGDILVDVRKGAFNSNKALQIQDFEADASKLAAITIPNAPVSNWYSGVMPAMNYTFISKTGVTQFRLRFTKDDNDDKGADQLRFYSGNDLPANRPLLIIAYYAP